MEARGATVQELVPMVLGDRLRVAYSNGDMEHAPVSVGQVVGLIHDLPGVAEIISSIIEEAGAIIKRLRGMGIG